MTDFTRFWQIEKKNQKRKNGSVQPVKQFCFVFVLYFLSPNGLGFQTLDYTLSNLNSSSPTDKNLVLINLHNYMLITCADSDGGGGTSV